MTVDFTALMLSQSDYRPNNGMNAEVTICYLVAFGIASAASLGTVLMGSIHAIVMHKYGAHKPLAVAAILEEITPQILTPITTMTRSTVIGAGCGVYLLHGWYGCLAFGVPGAIFFMLAFHYTMRADESLRRMMPEMMSQPLCESV